jgi:hypothetical protein
MRSGMYQVLIREVTALPRGREELLKTKAGQVISEI